MAKRDLPIDVNVRWRQRWLAPLLRPFARWPRVAQCLLWLMPLEVRTGHGKWNRYRIRWDGRGFVI